jgi:coenzyme F420 hydrogenase subunit beta
MKTFFNLVQDVQRPGLCHHCGGCVTFCTAINYGALELDPDGRPRYKDAEKCIECGLCYLICPEIHELDEEQKRLVSWSAPVGRVLGAHMARAKEETVRENATDGGVVTALLLHLFDMGRIDAAIVTRSTGMFRREPWIAQSREDILESGGFHFDSSPGMKLLSEEYSTYAPTIHELGYAAKKRLGRIAFVGTPCQINTIRRMEVLGIVPSDAIKYHLGLFCTGSFVFGPEQRKRLEEIGGFEWADIRKVNVKENLLVHLKSGEVKAIPLPELDFMKRYACRFCDDYSAEYADISFGGIGAEEGWTSVVVRSPLGRAVYADARGTDIEEARPAEKPGIERQILHTLEEWSDKKKEAALKNREGLLSRPVKVKG